MRLKGKVKIGRNNLQKNNSNLVKQKWKTVRIFCRIQDSVEAKTL